MKRVVVVAAVLLAVPAPAHATSAPGSGFASLSMSAVGSGESFVFTASNQVPAELWVPYAAADIHLGTGTATSSVAWPGEVGSTIGSAVVVLGGPPQAEMLNDPYVARARTGSGPPDVHNGSLQGSTMDAHATPDDVHSATRTSLVDAVATVAGSTSATAGVKVTGPAQAMATATSSARDVTVGGVVHVASVTSTAVGSTDGQRADARGSTVVTGLSVAGQAVTLDDSGLHIAGTPVPVAQARDAVESALAKAGMTLALGQPTRVVHAGQVEYATGSLLVSTPLGVLSLGGAQLRLAATRSDLLPPVPVAGGVPQPVTPVVAPVAAGGHSVVTPAPPQTWSSGPVPQVVRSLLHALEPLAVTTGYAWWWLPAGLGLALLSGVALRRIPGAVLPPASLPCPTEDQP